MKKRLSVGVGKFNMDKKRPLFIDALIIIGVMLWFVLSPPRFWLNLTKSVDLSQPEVTGVQLVDDYECRSCHQIGGGGALKGPSLDGITTQLDDVSIRLWLRNPKAIKGDTAMPNFHLSDSEIEAIVAYLESLENGD